MDSKISNLYSNIDQVKSKTVFEPSCQKEFKYNPYSNLCGVRPYSSKDVTTSAKMFNSEMDKIHKEKESQLNYYKTIQDFQKKEASFVKKTHRVDHIKQLFSTLNYKSTGTSYNQEYDFGELKKKEIANRDFTYNYKKSFIKTYEDEKIKHKIIIRK